MRPACTPSTNVQSLQEQGPGAPMPKQGHCEETWCCMSKDTPAPHILGASTNTWMQFHVTVVIVCAAALGHAPKRTCSAAASRIIVQLCCEPATCTVAEVLASPPGTPEVPELLLSGRASPWQQHRRHHALQINTTCVCCTIRSHQHAAHHNHSTPACRAVQQLLGSPCWQQAAMMY